MSEASEAFAQLARRVEELTAKEEIREVLHRYGRATDRGDVELLKTCYFDDAIDAHGEAFVGDAHEFAEFILGPEQLGQLRDYRHYITNTMIELDGDRAFVESSFLCTLELSLGDGNFADAQAEGRYFDVFQCRDGEWKIWRRLMQSEKYVWHQRDPQPFGSNGRPDGIHSKWPDDPVYRRFEVPNLIPEPVRMDQNGFAMLEQIFQERLSAKSSAR